MEAKDKLIVALDVSTAEEAVGIISDLSGLVFWFKVGLELMTAIGGPRAARMVNALGGRVFYDGKFADIPNTVGRASFALPVDVDMFSVHASAGVEAMRAAVEHRSFAQVFAVTALTSLGPTQVDKIFRRTPEETVLDFAYDALHAGVDGLIASPKETSLLREMPAFNRLAIVTPGVRPSWFSAGDQARVMPPGEAIFAGSDMVVVGRPITSPPKEIGSRANAARLILEEIDQAMARR